MQFKNNRYFAEMQVKMIKKIILFLAILSNLNCSVEGKEAGWFAKGRNYTDYCHGGDYEAGSTKSKSMVVCTVWISNETKCPLKYLGGNVESRFGIEPPTLIKPGDCGVFWSDGEDFITDGFAHYLCEDYGVIVELTWAIPFWKNNKFIARLKYFNSAAENQLFTITYEASTSGNKQSLNVFISENKRFCPCEDMSIYEDTTTLEWLQKLFSI